MKRRICLLMLLAACVSSCSHWKEIVFDYKTDEARMASFIIAAGSKRAPQCFSVVDGRYFLYVRPTDKIPREYLLLDQNDPKVKRVFSLIDRVLSKGEFTNHRRFSADDLEDYYSAQSEPNMEFTYSGACLHDAPSSENYIWYYMHDRELRELGYDKIAAELMELADEMEHSGAPANRYYRDPYDKTSNSGVSKWYLELKRQKGKKIPLPPYV